MYRYPKREASQVILMGASDYERHTQLPQLPAIHNNLISLEAALTNQITGVFSSEHCVVVDTPDSPRSLMTRFTRAANQAEDVLLAYYAGHGILGWDGDLHLTVRETDPDQLAGTAVPFEWIQKTINSSPASIRILVLDCCFSGLAIGAMSSDSAALNQIEIAGTYILASTTANRVSIAVPGERYTAFTGELVDLLSKRSDVPLLLRDLYRPLRAAMARRGLPGPRSSAVDSSGELALRRPSVPDIRQPDQPASRISKSADFESLPPVPEFPDVWTTFPLATSHPGPRGSVKITSAPTGQAKKAHLTKGDVRPRLVYGKRSVQILLITLTVIAALLILAVMITGIVQTSMGHEIGGIGSAVGALIFLFLLFLGCILVLDVVTRRNYAKQFICNRLRGRHVRAVR